jgi:erythromycin esterase-like protein
MVVWAHNSHLGDARATYMGERAQLNLGQLVREAYGEDCVLIGFTTFRGTVTAASEWDSEARCKVIRDALPNSIEDIFHRTGIPNFFVSLHGQHAHEFSKPLLQRAIGVLYLPDTERASHYFHSRLAQQFDAVFHFDKTTALEPLDAEALWVKGQEETYPFGL